MTLPLWPILLFGAFGVGVAVVSYWDDIREWAMDLAHGWVRATFGPDAAETLVKVIVRIDAVIVRGRSLFRRRVGAVMKGHRRARTVSEEVVAPEDLPEALREQVAREGSVRHVYD
jgi:hypothetical protein